MFSEWVKVVVVEVAKLGYLFGRWFSLIEEHLNLSLECSILWELADATSGLSVFFAVKTAAIISNRRNVVFEDRLDIKKVAKGWHYVSVFTKISAALTSIKAGHET